MLCFLYTLLLAACANTISGVAGYTATADGGTTPPEHVFQASTYGVIGDGKTDNSVALGRAIEAAIASGSGGQVVVGCGEFLVNTPSPKAPGQRSILYFGKASNVQITGQGPCSHLFTLVPHKTVLEFDQSRNISISALRISAVNAAYVETYGLDGGSAIRFSDVAQGSIESLEIDGASAGAIYLTTGTAHVTVSNNDIHDTYGAGIWEDDCGGTNDKNCLPSKPPSYNLYKDNRLRNTSLAALAAIDIDDGNATSHTIIQRNSISWTRAPLEGNDQVHCIQLNNVSQSSAIDNQCTSTPWDAIVITTGNNGSAENDVIARNVITSSGVSALGGAGIVLYNHPNGKGVSGFKVEDNSVVLSASDGIMAVSASGPGGVHDGIIVDNSIMKADQKSPGSNSGLRLDGVSSTRVRQNVIDGGGTSIAVGLFFRHSSGTGVTPTNLGNTVTSIIGPPLEIQ